MASERALLLVLCANFDLVEVTVLRTPFGAMEVICLNWMTSGS
jgi:hypothetical protein